MFSFTTAFVTVYLYGAIFSHKRYWEGTIRFVAKTETDVLESILTSDIDKAIMNLDTNTLNSIFQPLQNKLNIQIMLNGSKIFDNISKRLALNKNPKIFKKSLPKDNHVEFIVDTYKPPSWNHQFKSWVTDIPNALTYKRDFITVPFLFFFLYSFRGSGDDSRLPVTT